MFLFKIGRIFLNIVFDLILAGLQVNALVGDGEIVKKDLHALGSLAKLVKNIRFIMRCLQVVNQQVNFLVFVFASFVFEKIMKIHQFVADLLAQVFRKCFFSGSRRSIEENDIGTDRVFQLFKYICTVFICIDSANSVQFFVMVNHRYTRLLINLDSLILVLFADKFLLRQIGGSFFHCLQTAVKMHHKLDF